MGEPWRSLFSWGNYMQRSPPAEELRRLARCSWPDREVEQVRCIQHSSKHLALASLLVLFLVHPTAPLWAQDADYFNNQLESSAPAEINLRTEELKAQQFPPLEREGPDLGSGPQLDDR